MDKANPKPTKAKQTYVQEHTHIYLHIIQKQNPGLYITYNKHMNRKVAITVDINIKECRI